MKKKVRFLLPVILCCLLVCGTAAGSHYAQGVSLMEQALAAEEAYQSAGVVSAEELSQALEGEEALSTEEILDVAEQVRRSAAPELEPYFTGSLEERFSQNCREGREAPLEWGFSVDRGFTNPKLLGWKSLSSTEAQVRFRADTWLSTIYSYLLEGAPRYTVEVLFSQCTYTVQMKQEDGQWKVASQDMDQLFAPDSYQPIQGGFASYQEALDFVNSLDVQALDPFAL